VVSDDVVQVAGDAGALTHRGLVLEAVGHRAKRLVSLGNRLAALPARVAEHQRADDHEQEQYAREAWVAVVERVDRVRKKREHEQSRPEPPIPGGEQRERAEERDQRGDRQGAGRVRYRHQDAEDDRARRPREPTAREGEGSVARRLGQIADSTSSV
jgi:hypothetical protein